MRGYCGSYWAGLTVPAAATAEEDSESCLGAAVVAYREIFDRRQKNTKDGITTWQFSASTNRVEVKVARGKAAPAEDSFFTTTSSTSARAAPIGRTPDQPGRRFNSCFGPYSSG